jgi:hypothetical protein
LHFAIFFAGVSHMIITLQECSDITGKSVSTIYRAIQNGKLSSTLTSDGKRGIDVSELARVWPIIHPPKDTVDAKNDNSHSRVMTGHAKDVATTDLPITHNSEVKFLNEKVVYLEKALEEMRSERASLFKMMDRLQTLIVPALPKPPKNKKGKKKNKFKDQDQEENVDGESMFKSKKSKKKKGKKK